MSELTMTNQIIIFLWKSAWAWAPVLGVMIAAGIYELKKGIKL